MNELQEALDTLKEEFRMLKVSLRQEFAELLTEVTLYYSILTEEHGKLAASQQKLEDSQEELAALQQKLKDSQNELKVVFQELEDAVARCDCGVDIEIRGEIASAALSSEAKRSSADKAYDDYSKTFAITRWQPNPWFRAQLKGGPKLITRISLGSESPRQGTTYILSVTNEEKINEKCGSYKSPKKGPFHISLDCGATGSGFEIKMLTSVKGRNGQLILNDVEVIVDE